MAPGESFHEQPSPPQEPVRLDGLEGVRRAGGGEPAGGRGEGGDPLLVEPDQSEGEASQHKRSVRRINSVLSSWKARSYAPGRARTSTSNDRSAALRRGSTSSRPSSLSLRRRRFRSTTRRLCLGTMVPKRGPSAGAGVTNTSSSPARYRRACRRIRRISVPRRIRARRGHRYPGPPGAGGSPESAGPTRDLLPSCLDGDPLPALLSPPIQGPATPLRRHAGAETVLVAALAVAWLVCGSHGDPFRPMAREQPRSCERGWSEG